MVLKNPSLRCGKSLIHSIWGDREDRAMMGVQKAEAQLFYELNQESHVPADHLLREIDRFLDMDGMREKLRPF